MRCECGYEFATGAVAEASLERARADRGRARVRVALGFVAMIVGWVGAIAIPRLFAHAESDGIAIAMFLARAVFVALGLSGLAYALFSLRGTARSRRILRGANARADVPAARVVPPRD